MDNVTSNKEVLTKPTAGAHFVQVYQDSKTLVDAVCHFVSDQLQPEEAIIIIATHSHRKAIQRNLLALGVPLDEGMQRGQYNFFDADVLLTAFVEDGEFDIGKAESMLGEILENVRKRYQSIRAFGEIVDLQWQRGDKDNAKALERLWGKLINQHSASLLCAYRVDNLAPASYPHDIECLCATHTHFLPSQDFGLLDSALAKATENVMGVSLSGMMNSIGKFRHPTTSMPAAQASLLYISKTMPITTEFILHQLRKQLSTQAKPG